MENNQMEYIPLWLRYLPMFQKRNISDAQIGALVRAMMEYQMEGTEPDYLDEAMSVFWLFIQQDLMRAQVKYDQAVENGRKGGRPRKNPEKPPETPGNPEKGRTTTKTTSTSTTESTSTTQTTTSPCAPGGDVSVSQTAYGEFGWVKLTKKQYRELQALMGIQELESCIAYIDRSAQSTNNRNCWQDWALVLRRCYEGRWHEAPRKQDPIPKGASGVLGQAELEAIQRVLGEAPPKDTFPFP